jgi:hypothetical protein
LQALHIVTHVGDDGALLQIAARLFQSRLNAGLHRAHQIADMAGQVVMLLQRSYCCVHSAAAIVAEHHDHLGAEHGGAKFKAGQSIGRDKVAGDPDDEQISRHLVESELWRDARIGAAQNGGERRLSGSTAGASGREITLIRPVGHIACIAVDQQLQRRVRGSGGSGRLCLSGSDQRRRGGQSDTGHHQMAATQIGLLRASGAHVVFPPVMPWRGSTNVTAV